MDEKITSDLEELARYLDSDQSPDDCMGLSDLDGFLTGIVVGPELIMPSEWLPVIWGDEEPEFELQPKRNRSSSDHGPVQRDRYRLQCRTREI